MGWPSSALPHFCNLNGNIVHILKRLESYLAPRLCLKPISCYSCKFQKAMKTRIFFLGHLAADYDLL